MLFYLAYALFAPFEVAVDFIFPVGLYTKEVLPFAVIAMHSAFQITLLCVLGSVLLWIYTTANNLYQVLFKTTSSVARTALWSIAVLSFFSFALLFLVSAVFYIDGMRVYGQWLASYYSSVDVVFNKLREQMESVVEPIWTGADDGAAPILHVKPSLQRPAAEL